MAKRIKVELIDDWRACWRFTSLQLGAIGATATATLIAFPDAALYAWGILPADLKAVIPERYVPLIGVGVFVLSMFARLVKQRKPEPKGTTDNDNDNGATQGEN